MSEPPDQRDVDQLVTVFEASSPEDVSHARRLWSSVSLLPPLESRLVSPHIRQRLPVSRPQRGATAASVPRSPGPPPPGPPPPGPPPGSRQRYEAMAEQRREVMVLLRRQRNQRNQKELLSATFTPQLDTCEEKNRSS